jgi:hypothetical protein
MNVDQLLRIPSDLPGRLPVVIEDSSAGWMQGAGLYLAPVHFDSRISGAFLHAGHQGGPDDCEALVISAFNQSNADYLEISEPPLWTRTVMPTRLIPAGSGSRSHDQQVGEVRCKDISPSSISERGGARQ